ncbi:hypothetical protein ACUXAV_004961 [Cupriavidus metallidurans]|jgi:hypothetical protein|uniref:hypothetical protein n=1 Tax=Cupriavidus TaxID=106589 RepID=UPI0004931ED1|nr:MULTISPECIES: hypothetical protein [Cupriavidus]AVA38096.1 hypothetical protein C3Z06_31335 [Cupriavidus metallidurans]MCA3775906.1 hypothetical protein [Cutibacterium sp.]GMG94702.1 hypothetical protein Cmtc_59220 [Cupriavidus sp. TKC]
MAMAAAAVQANIDDEFHNYHALIAGGHWSLQHAHDVLAHADRDGLDLFKIAGLAKAIACHQCG